MKMQFDFCPLLSVAFICAMLSPLISKAPRHRQHQERIHFICARMKMIQLESLLPDHS